MIIGADWAVTAALDEPRRAWAVRVVDGLIEDSGRIVDLRARYPGDEFCDGSGCVLLPGFVNAHVHLYGVLAHGVPAPAVPVADFWGFLDDYWWPLVENALDHEMIAAAAAWVTAEMAAGGTTSFFDILEAPNALGGALLAQREAVAGSGLRGVLSFEATERMGEANGQAGLDENVSFIEDCRARGAGEGAGRDGRVSGAMCIHTTFTCSEPFIRQAFDAAADLDVFCHAHVNEGVHEGRWCEEHHGVRTLEFYDRIGVASPRFQASQCVQLSPREIDIIAGSGIRVSHMPLSNCEVGGGIAPVLEMLERGVTVGLGSDGYLNDMFAVMRGAFLLHRAATLDPGAISAATVLHMATEGSARALGLERVGRLEPGWHADLQLVDLEGPRGLPTPVETHNLLDQLVLWRSASHVRTVMVGGDWIVEGGEVIGADIGELRARTLEQAARLWS
ncbi:MAG: amidohydrolase family protein [Acidimicrobiaceae bacterium]|nr:amidohydrolase family protein [Acidimicrobiaceae bacterium]MYE97045.1 amidohydrolase family protein [Acidimicrobiaceae bacterium]MYI53836.1 amidohydrolase family protein [Acidimicrobiaceae bacterium]